MKLKHLPAIGALTLLAATASEAAVVASRVSADTYLRNDGTSGPQNGDTDHEILIGFNANQRLNSLVRFDVTQIINDVNTLGGGNFANLTINSASLQVFERRNNSGPSYSNTLTISVNAYTFNFDPAVAAWADPDGNGSNATGDTTAGGTVGANLGSLLLSWTNATADNDSSTVTLDATGLKLLLQTAPTGGTLGNVNFILQGNPGSTDDSEFRSIVSDQAPTSPTDRRALLTIDYTVVPEPSVALLGGLGLLGLLRRRR